MKAAVTSLALCVLAGLAGCDVVHGKRSEPAREPTSAPRTVPAERTVTVQAGPLAIAPEHVGLFFDEFHPTVAALAAVTDLKELSQ